MTKESANRRKRKQTKRIKPTPSNPNLPSTERDAYEKLTEMHKAAVEMRLQGYKYRHIAGYIQEKYGVKYSEATVRWWFSKDATGYIYRAYLERKAMRAKDDQEVFDEAQEKLRGLVGDAILVVATALQKNNLDAAIKVLEYNGIKQISITKPASEATELVRELIRVEKQKLQLLEGKNGSDGGAK